MLYTVDHSPSHTRKAACYDCRGIDRGVRAQRDPVEICTKACPAVLLIVAAGKTGCQPCQHCCGRACQRKTSLRGCHSCFRGHCGVALMRPPKSYASLRQTIGYTSVYTKLFCKLHHYCRMTTHSLGPYGVHVGDCWPYDRGRHGHLATNMLPSCAGVV